MRFPTTPTIEVYPAHLAECWFDSTEYSGPDGPETLHQPVQEWLRQRRHGDGDALLHTVYGFVGKYRVHCETWFESHRAVDHDTDNYQKRRDRVRAFQEGAK
jgi:hypothetical protein